VRWDEASVIGKKEVKVSVCLGAEQPVKKRRKKRRQFAVCVRNRGYHASLELRKIYEVLPDPEAAAHGLIRVIDESGEDYLYPKTFFIQLDLSQPVETAIRRAS